MANFVYPPKGRKGSKSRMPASIAFCYPNYRQLQTGMTFKKMREQAAKRKLKIKFKPPPKIKRT